MTVIMNTDALLTHLDSLLRPLGFERRGATWNRSGKSVVEVVNVQVSKAGDAATVNAGVLDPEIHAMVWADTSQQFVDEPSCTVRARIGELIDGRDVWWELSDDATAANIQSKVKAHVLPFLERMCTREAMARWLTDSGVTRRKYPPPIISLAIMMKSLGDAAGACTLLSELRKKTVAGWRVRIDEVAERLGCE